LSTERRLPEDDEHKTLDRQKVERDSVRLKVLTALFDPSCSFMLLADLDASLQQIVGAGVQQTASDWGVLLLKDEGRPRFEARVAVDCNSKLLVPAEYTLTGQTAAQAAAAAQPLVWNQGEQSEAVFASLGASKKAVAALATRLTARGRVVGILALARGPGRPAFGQAELELVSLFADLAAIAIDNIRYCEHTRTVCERLHALNVVTGEYLLLAAHELRSSLAVISTYAELLGQEAGSAQRPLIDTLVQGIKRLDSLTWDLAQPGFLKAGAPGPRVLRFALPRLLTEVVSEFAALTEDKGQSVEISCSEEVAYLVADPGRVGIVLASLLDNAVKFSPVGGHIALRAVSTDDGVCLTVSDSGPGIPEQQQEAIFRPFQHLETGLMGGGSRLGLGLALSKRIVEAQGGSLWLQSVVGQGSSFHFTIPNCVPRPASPDGKCTASADGDAPRIPNA
jgi:signal transduction histidine kinase